MVQATIHSLLTLATLLLTVPTSYCAVSCTAGTFTIGSQASVKCDFGEDVTGKNFNVVQYNNATANDVGTYVVLCNWSNSTRECSPQDGYSFDKTSIRNTLDIVINSVQESMAGMYVCQIVPDKGAKVDTCYLNVVAATSTTTTTTTESSRTTDKPTALFQDLKGTDTDKSIGGIVAVLVIVIILLLLIVLCFAGVWWRYDIVNKRKPQETGENNEIQDGWHDFVFCRPFMVIMGVLNCNRPPAENRAERGEGVPFLDQANPANDYFRERPEGGGASNLHEQPNFDPNEGFQKSGEQEGDEFLKTEKPAKNVTSASNPDSKLKPKPEDMDLPSGSEDDDIDDDNEDREKSKLGQVEHKKLVQN